MAAVTNSSAHPRAPSDRASQLKAIQLSALKEALKKYGHLPLEVVASARRLVGNIVARVLEWLLNLPGLIGKALRKLFISKPARFVVLVAASIVCASLSIQRSSGATVQLSSSLSLLFGMIKLQGTLNLQLGRPKCDHITDSSQNEELRISCPQDLKEHIVRFLEAQAARNAELAPVWHCSPGKQAPAAYPCGDSAWPPELAARGVPPATPSYTPVATATGTPAGAVAVESDGERAPMATWSAEEIAVQTGAAPAVDDAAAPAVTAGADGLRQLGSAAQPAVAPDATAPVASTVLRGIEALLPSTPPLGSSPPDKATCCLVTGQEALGGALDQDSALAKATPGPTHIGLGSRHALPAQECPNPDQGDHSQQDEQPVRSPAPAPARYISLVGPVAMSEPPALDYPSLMSYAATYRPPMGPGAVHEAPMPHGSVATAKPAAGANRGRGVAGGAAVRRSPDSILGLHGVGLEGWTEGTRAWERMHAEE